MDYVQPPAIMEEIQKSVPNCSYLRNSNAKIRYIFPIPLEHAPELLPFKDGLERIIGVPDVKKDGVGYRFLRYKESRNPWDVVVVYRDRDGEPIKIYYAKGKVDYLTDKQVHISEPHDLVFLFDRNNENVNGNFELDNLKHYIIHAYYTCNAGERWILNFEFNKNKPNKEKPKKPKDFKPIMRAQTQMNFVGLRRKYTQQKIPS